MKEKESSNLISGGLRREIWIHPGGKRIRRTTTATNESRLSSSDFEDLDDLSSLEVSFFNKKFKI